MLLYTEKQLDIAYRIDCKARTSCNEPWIKREEFRPLYEDLIESYMIAYAKDNPNKKNVPEYLLDSINDLLESTLTLD
tara:strand:- start:739 stop:972 length:234 start_codon:yes stop_codon:yes gene_type:complete